MRKIVYLVLGLAILTLLTGCNSGNNTETAARKGNGTASVADVLQAGMEEADRKNSENENKSVEPDDKAINKEENTDNITPDIAIEDNKPEKTEITDAPIENSDKIDIDLTELSSTMVYSEVYYMTTMPEDYIGKTVKMDGLFAIYYDEPSDKYYFACIIQDATACCARGVEFELTGNPVYPDDYPEEGTEICVKGVFDTYDEGDYTYCTLRNASFED